MKICSVCGVEKPEEAFHRNNSKGGRHPYCAACRGAKRRAAYALRTEDQKAADRARAAVGYERFRGNVDAQLRSRARSSEWHQQNKNRRNADARAQYDRVSEQTPEKHVLYRLRARTKKLGLRCDLELEDIVIPPVCPVLGIPLRFRREGAKGPKPDSPSVDRIVPSLGYTRGNVRVMSNRANTLINNATIEELETVLAFLRATRASSVA